MSVSFVEYSHPDKDDLPVDIPEMFGIGLLCKPEADSEKDFFKSFTSFAFTLGSASFFLVPFSREDKL